MKTLTALLALLTLLAVAGCTPPETYPISGERCEPGDPVQGMDASDCMPPV